MNIVDFREQYPGYSDMSDLDLANSLYIKSYSDMDRDEFMRQFMPEPEIDVGPINVAETVPALDDYKEFWDAPEGQMEAKAPAFQQKDFDQSPYAVDQSYGIMGSGSYPKLPAPIKPLAPEELEAQSRVKAVLEGGYEPGAIDSLLHQAQAGMAGHGLASGTYGLMGDWGNRLADVIDNKMDPFVQGLGDPVRKAASWFKDVGSRQAVASAYDSIMAAEGRPDGIAGETLAALGAIPDMAMTLVLTAITKNPNIGLSAMAIQVAADTYGRSRYIEGMSEGEAIGKALRYAAYEVGPEKMFGVLSPIASKMPGFLKVAKTAALEAPSEIITEQLTMLDEAAFEGRMPGISEIFERNIKAGYAGGVMGAAMGGGGALVGRAVDRYQEREDSRALKNMMDDFTLKSGVDVLDPLAKQSYQLRYFQAPTQGALPEFDKAFDQAGKDLDASFEINLQVATPEQAPDPISIDLAGMDLDVPRGTSETLFDELKASEEVGPFLDRQMGVNQPVELAEGLMGGVITPEQEAPLPSLPQGEPGVYLERLDPADIETDTERFQFKTEGIDEQGTNKTLSNVTQWNPAASGMVMVWERKDGQKFIVDGHQRLALAKRLIDQKPMLNALVYKEAEGHSPMDAMVEASVVNISQNTGSVVDAARIIRLVEELGEVGGQTKETLAKVLPKSGPINLHAPGVAKLAEDPFMAVVNDTIKPEHGAIIGERYTDPAQQMAAVKALAQTKPASIFQANDILDQMDEAGFSEGQADIFGDTMADNFFKERAKLVEKVTQMARKTKSIYQGLVKNEGRITGTGRNRLDTSTNKQIVEEQNQRISRIGLLARSNKEISDVLNEQAEQLGSGQVTLGKAAGIVEGAITSYLEAGGVIPERAQRAEAGYGVDAEIEGTGPALDRGASIETGLGQKPVAELTREEAEIESADLEAVDEADDQTMPLFKRGEALENKGEHLLGKSIQHEEFGTINVLMAEAPWGGAIVDNDGAPTNSANGMSKATSERVFLRKENLESDESAGSEDADFELAHMMRRAARHKPEFDEMMAEVAASVNGQVLAATLKLNGKSSAKTKNDYAGDPSKMSDILRGTIIVSKPADVQPAIDALLDYVSSSDSFALPHSNNYRNNWEDMGADNMWGTEYRDGMIKLVMKDGRGHETVVELQFNIPEMIAAKEEGRALYSQQVELDQKEMAGQLTQKEETQREEVKEKQRRLYRPVADEHRSQPLGLPLETALSMEKNASRVISEELNEKTEDIGKGEGLGPKSVAIPSDLDATTGQPSESAKIASEGKLSSEISSAIDESVTENKTIPYTEAVEVEARISRDFRSLGIMRFSLPQIQTAQLAEFIRFMELNGVKSQRVTIKAKHLKPTQRERNEEKVERISKFTTEQLQSRPLPISKGGFVLDGHHWMWGAQAKNPEIELTAIQFDVEMFEFLRIATRWESATYVSIEDPGTGKYIGEFKLKRSVLNETREPSSEGGRVTAASRAVSAAVGRSIGQALKENAYLQIRTPDALKGQVRAIKKVFGKNVVVIRKNNDVVPGFEGVVFDGDTIYINETLQNPFTATVFHELLHQLKMNRPDLYRHLAAVALMSTSKERFGSFRDAFNELTDSRGENRLSNDVVFEELMGDTVADAFLDENFLRLLEHRSPGKFKELMEAILEYLNEIMTSMRGKTMGSGQFYRDVESLHETMAEVFNEYAEGVSVDGKAGEAKPKREGQAAIDYTLPESKEEGRDIVESEAIFKSAMDQIKAFNDSMPKNSLFEIPTWDLGKDIDPDSIRFSFGGVNAKTADLKKLEKAQLILNQVLQERELLRPAGSKKTETSTELHTKEIYWRPDKITPVDLFGKYARQAWRETGWFMMPDHQWRFEISDHDAEFKMSKESLWAKKNYIVNQILDHDIDRSVRLPGVFNAYPALRSVVLELYTDEHAELLGNEGAEGSFIEGGSGMTLNTIRLAARRRPRVQSEKYLQDESENTALSILLHENQHAIQQTQEAFARGGSPSDFSILDTAKKFSVAQRAQELMFGDYAKTIEEAHATLKEAPDGLETIAAVKALKAIKDEDPDKYRHISSLLSKYSGDGGINWDNTKQAVRDLENDSFTPHESYLRLHGEAEARMVQKRLARTSEENAKIYPLDDLDVPAGELIIRFQRSGLNQPGLLEGPTSKEELKAAQKKVGDKLKGTDRELVEMDEGAGELFSQDPTTKGQQALFSRGIPFLDYIQERKVTLREDKRDVERGGLEAKRLKAVYGYAGESIGHDVIEGFEDPGVSVLPLAGYVSFQRTPQQPLPLKMSSFDNWTLPSMTLREALHSDELRFWHKLDHGTRKVRMDIRQELQDRMIPVSRVIDAIQKGEATVTDFMNVYERESLIYGRVGDRFEMLEREVLEPMLKLAARSGIANKDIGEYLYALHAPARNAMILDRDPENSSGSGMTDEEAAKIIKKVESGSKAKVHKKLVEYVRKITEETRQNYEDYGLVMPAVLESWKTKTVFNKTYVPLKGWDQSPEDEKFGSIGKGMDIRGDEVRRALGRTTKPSDILSNITADYKASLIRGEKNSIGQGLYKLAIENPNPNLWEVGTFKMRKELDKKTGMVVEKIDLGEIRNSDEVFMLKIDGKAKWVRLKDPRLLKAMKNLGAEQLDVVTRQFAKLNRWLSVAYTMYNPEFLVSNFTKDIQTAAIKLSADDLKEIRKKAINVKAIRKSIGAMFFELYDKNKQDTEYSRYAREFKEDGAHTDYFRQMSIEQYAKNMDNMLSLYKDSLWGKARRGGKAIKSLVENANGAVENGVRLSVYIELRKVGASRQKAAAAAKNLTVNFNRKGVKGAVINSYFLFYNAGIQGVVLAGRTLQSKTGRKIWAGLGVAGAMSAIFNQLIGGEDDDGVPFIEKLSDYERERNWIIMIPPQVIEYMSESSIPFLQKVIKDGRDTGGRYLKFPMPWVFNVPYVIGDAMVNSIMFGEKQTEAAVRVLLAINNSINPLGESSLLGMVTPTALDPFLNLKDNKNFWGGQIYKEKRPGDRSPLSSDSFYGVAPLWKNMAKWLNEMGGGDRWNSSNFDYHPETLRHWYQFFTGGAGSFVNRVGENVSAALYGTNIPWISGDEPLRPEKLAFLRKLYGKVYRGADSAQYYDRREELNTLMDEYKDRKKDASLGRDSAAIYIEFVRANRDVIGSGRHKKLRNRCQYTGGGMISQLKASDCKLKKLRGQRKDLRAMDQSKKVKDRIRIIEGRMLDVQRAFNKRYNDKYLDQGWFRQLMEDSNG